MLETTAINNSIVDRSGAAVPAGDIALQLPADGAAMAPELPRALAVTGSSSRFTPIPRRLSVTARTVCPSALSMISSLRLSRSTQSHADSGKNEHPRP